MKTQTHLNRWFGVLGCLLLASGVYAQETSSKFLSVYNSSTGKMEEIEISENLTEIAGFNPQSETETVMEKGVIGREDWYQVDGLKYPYSAVVSIVRPEFVGGYPGCSGALIGPYTVLTNAHCMYDKKGKLAEASTFNIRAGGESTGRCAIGTKMYVAPGNPQQINSRSGLEPSKEKDYAIIVLDRPLGQTAGYLSFKSVRVKKNERIAVMGFPGEKPHDRPWYSPGKITDVFQGYFHMDADAIPGNSGSPVVYQNDLKTIIALETFGEETPNPRYNGAIMSTNSALLNFVNKYKNERSTGTPGECFSLTNLPEHSQAQQEQMSSIVTDITQALTHPSASGRIQPVPPENPGAANSSAGNIDQLRRYMGRLGRQGRFSTNPGSSNSGRMQTQPSQPSNGASSFINRLRNLRNRSRN